MNVPDDMYARDQNRIPSYGTRLDEQRCPIITEIVIRSVAASDFTAEELLCGREAALEGGKGADRLLCTCDSRNISARAFTAYLSMPIELSPEAPTEFSPFVD